MEHLDQLARAGRTHRKFSERREELAIEADRRPAAISTYHEVWSEYGILVVVAIPCDPEKGRFGQQVLVLFDIIVDPILAVEMRNKVFSIRQLDAVGESAPDIMLQGRCLGGGVGKIDALRNFNLNSLLRPVSDERLEEIGDCKDSMRTLRSSGLAYISAPWVKLSGILPQMRGSEIVRR